MLFFFYSFSEAAELEGISHFFLIVLYYSPGHMCPVWTSVIQLVANLPSEQCWNMVLLQIIRHLWLSLACNRKLMKFSFGSWI